ncbi:MAG: hypothetical protein HZB42_10685 [Sphingobacteriales bacterium]|nr:hypothetical protein [Sphingobacteriales bacterium]
MHPVKKILGIFILFATTSFFCCRNKQENKQGIVGKWVYKEMSYTSANRSFNKLNEKQQKRRKEEDDREARGTTFLFNPDKTFVITPGQQDEQPITGTYELKEGGELYMIRKNSRSENATISFPDKNTLRLEARQDGIIIIFTRTE